ncbi:alpha/beta hydrolase [uncultured Acetobacteroides sp.]|uniref:alpha/beta fold hydrolase n=1 Tax=uncultured Acetobacteroides sp. TaxID=1760811 RepID=UPI0029F4A502|nr:alpha/beta hydrolase [uncultured Acetobacteroides sp.]
MKRFAFAAIAILMAFTGFAQKSAIRVEVTGKGSPVILLPGFGCPGSVWNETVAELKKNHECHVVTYAGFDGVAPVDTLWLPTVEKSIESYISNKGLKDVTVVGHSIGGTFGLMLCAAPQSRVTRLVVVDMLPCIGMVMIPNFKPEYVTFDNPYNKRLLAMDKAAFGAMQQQMAANMCADTLRQRQIVEWMMKADRKTYVYGYTELMRLDLRESVKDIQQPVLVLAAGKYPSKDQIVKMNNEQYANLKNKTVKFVDNSAHFVMFDQPTVLLNELKGFIPAKR